MMHAGGGDGLRSRSTGVSHWMRAGMRRIADRTAKCGGNRTPRTHHAANRRALTLPSVMRTCTGVYVNRAPGELARKSTALRHVLAANDASAT